MFKIVIAAEEEVALLSKRIQESNLRNEDIGCYVTMRDEAIVKCKEAVKIEKQIQKRYSREYNELKRAQSHMLIMHFVTKGPI